jgi:hypothetical protein
MDRSIFQRVSVAFLFALILQWGTAGAAIIILWFTPTVGLGCRSFTFLLYAVASTVAWFFLVTSSFLAHFLSRRHPVFPTFFSIIKGLLYWAGNILAVLNAVGIIVASILQFSNVYENCYCNSSVLGLKAHHAYDTILVAGSDVKKPWAAGVVLGCACTFVYILFVYILFG